MIANRTIDTVVIGAGIVGCSIAWHLGVSGRSVIVLDRKGVGSGATGIQPGGVRTQWSSPVTRGLALESRAFYLDIQNRLSTRIDPQFDACGYLFVASTEETMAVLRREAEEQRRDGLQVDLLSSAEVNAIVPGIDSSKIVGAVFGPSDGYMSRPGAPIAAFEEGCRAVGVGFEVTPATRINTRTPGTDVTLASGEVVSAGSVVIAAGVDSVILAQSEGMFLPIYADPKYLFYSNPIHQNLVRPLVVFQDDHFAIKHLADGSVLASDLTLGKQGDIDESLAKRNVTVTSHELIPVLEHVRFPVMVRGIYDATPDGQAILGPINDSGSVWVAAGMNGRGMMLAPSIGRLVAEGLDSPRSGNISPELRIDRFSAGRTPGSGEDRVI